VYGDFSRGHEPDLKRGHRYRRVLPQMGRPLIDSDLAASVDAVLGATRDTARMLGGPQGSSDLGFLVTPGRLLSVFSEAADRATVTLGAPDVWVDYRYRYANRYPALYIGAGAAPARVVIPPLQALDLTGPHSAALWSRVEAPVTMTINGTAVSLTPMSPDVPERTAFATGAADLAPLQIDVPAGGEVWLFQLEQDEVAGDEPVFWTAPGSYEVDGLVTRTPGGAFPYLSYPVEAGFPWNDSPPGPRPIGILPPAIVTGDRIIAYLEFWERAITGIEDAGTVEQALGPDGTSVRAELVTQVKLATVGGGVLPADPVQASAAIRAAFERPAVSGGEITIDVPPATTTSNPCAIPEVSGYSGADNRLYRIEVHEGGDRTQVLFKWSRDNASDLLAARIKDKKLVFGAGTPLADGDVVEVLSSVVDLGDSVIGRYTATGFTPAQRSVGQLAQLVATPTDGTSDDVTFRMVDPETPLSEILLDETRYGILDDAVLKVRRWHGLIRPGNLPAGPTGPFTMEDGISAKISATGEYRPGQWWQYEARYATANANGPWRAQPHGPERRYAPLALLAYELPGDPLHLVAWLDDRFSPPGSLLADDSRFEGERVGSVSDTVQEALEELFERPPVVLDGTCGEIIIEPQHTDLQAVFDTIPQFGSVRICIHPGAWDVQTTVVVREKGDLWITGAGAATSIGGKRIETLLQFESCGNVRIQDMTFDAQDGGLVPADGLAGRLRALNCRGLDLERVTVSCAGATSRCRSAVEVTSFGFPNVFTPVVRVRDCTIVPGHTQTGLLLVNPWSVTIEGCTIQHNQNEFSLAQAALEDPRVAGRVARQVIDDIVFGETDEFPNDFLLSGENLMQAENAPDGRFRFLVYLRSWGSQFLTFTSALSLDDGQWLEVLNGNPMPGDWSQAQAPDGFILSNLRKLRSRMVEAMFSPAPVFTGGTRQALVTLGAQLKSKNVVTTGGQGIVVAGRGEQPDKFFFPEPLVLGGFPRPDVRITGNRITNFIQGIHVSASEGQQRGMSHRVTITDNEIRLSVPSLAAERHGIFVGSVFHGKIKGNSVELTNPGPRQWAEALPIDGIVAHGTFGPSLWIMQNSVIGPRRGVVATATNHARSPTNGWNWVVGLNAHTTARGKPVVPETTNW
jgi:hypothetical protein